MHPDSTAAPSPGGSLPQLYAHEQLMLPPSAQHASDDAPGIVGELMRAADIAQRESLVRTLLKGIGFDWLGYGGVTFLRGHWWPLHFFTAHANADWVQRYFAHRLYEVDLRQLRVSPSGLPLRWDTEQIEAAPYSAAHSTGDDPAGRRLRFLDDLRASGIRSGLMFRLASPTQPNQATVISLQASEPGRRWITDEVVGRALTLGLSLHDYVSRHVRVADTGGARVEISATQQYILQHLLQGRSDKEIAHRLDLSAHTIDYHMRQLRRRFAVRNRVQLVNAVQQGDSDFGVLSEM